MSYEISQGITEESLKDWLAKAAKKYGTFKDGRVDYTKADCAPIVMCTVMYGNKILLVKRGYGLADAEGYWSTVNGFIDEVKPVKEQVIQEVFEELNIVISKKNVKVAPSYRLQQAKEKRNYIVFACLVTLHDKPVIKLDYENTDFTWISREDLEKHHILNDLPYAIDQALKQSK